MFPHSPESYLSIDTISKSDQDVLKKRERERERRVSAYGGRMSVKMHFAFFLLQKINDLHWRNPMCSLGRRPRLWWMHRGLLLDFSQDKGNYWNFAENDSRKQTYRPRSTRQYRQGVHSIFDLNPDRVFGVLPNGETMVTEIWIDMLYSFLFPENCYVIMNYNACVRCGVLYR